MYFEIIDNVASAQVLANLLLAANLLANVVACENRHERQRMGRKRDSDGMPYW